MKPSERYRELVKNWIWPLMRSHGFKRKRHDFVFCDGTNWALVYAGVGKRHTPEWHEFAVGYGVVSRLILEFIPDQKIPEMPNAHHCHWRNGLQTPPEFMRLGGAGWVITADNDLDAIGRSACGCIEQVALPKLQRLMTDTALRDILAIPNPTRDNWTIHGNIDRLTHLSILANELGPPELLDQALEELERESAPRISYWYRQHVKRLEAWRNRRTQ